MESVASILSILSCYISSCIHKEKRDPVSTCEYCNCPWRFWRYISLLFLLCSVGFVFFSITDNAVLITVFLFSGFSALILGYSFYTFPAFFTHREVS